MTVYHMSENDAAALLSRSSNFRLFHNSHLAAQIMALHMVKSLNHVLSLLQVHTICGIFALLNQGQSVGSAQAAADGKGALLRVIASLRVIRNAERAILATFAISACLVLPTVHNVVVAWRAEIVAALAAHEKANGAAVHALEVDKLVSVLCTHVATKSHGLPSARLAEKIFPLGLILSLHCLLAVLHATKVGLMAVEALVESAEVDGKGLKLSEVCIVRVDYATARRISLISGRLDGQFYDLPLLEYMLGNKFTEDGYIGR